MGITALSRSRVNTYKRPSERTTEEVAQEIDRAWSAHESWRANMDERRSLLERRRAERAQNKAAALSKSRERSRRALWRRFLCTAKRAAQLVHRDELAAAWRRRAGKRAEKAKKSSPL